ncbi:hypothetical protein LQW54_007545 [Pestalotiopsis sp. IQ-011]
MVLRSVVAPEGGGEDFKGIMAESQNSKLSIHPLASRSGILVKVDPPRCPNNKFLTQVPCDIVLVIDVSYSMSEAAPVVGFDEQGEVTREHPGFSVLDIAKHAALTVLEALDSGDRLGIVKFSDRAEVVQDLRSMSPDNKKSADGHIRDLHPENSTNLWQGIVEGVRLFGSHQGSRRNSAILLLTDGQPNGQVPLQGYAGGLRSMGPLPAAIHTFGFSNDIMSGLLKSIAEVGGGNYSFIPDAGMVGTVIVNAVAHLQSTFANQCTLDLTCGAGLGLRNDSEDVVGDEEAGNLISLTSDLDLDPSGEKRKKITIPLGSIHYGQSRTIYLSSSTPDWFKLSSEELEITARVQYSRSEDKRFILQAQRNALEPTSLPDWEVAYHQSRAMICQYLSSYFTLEGNGERKAVDLKPKDRLAAQKRFNSLIKELPAKSFGDDYNKSLVQDLEGQIKLAVFSEDYLRTWGLHYFLSLWDAHAHQMRNSFKDPGVHMYDGNSPLFLKCQKALAFAFDTAVRPPEPSLKLQADAKYSDGRAAVSMSSYNRSDNPCFSASSLVTLAGGQNVPASVLQRGHLVQTAAGSRKVVTVLKTRVRNTMMCRVESLLVTPWHPIMRDGSWTFPAAVATEALRYSGTIYSILLEPDADPQAHAIQVGRVWAVTMGHGITNGKDARAHRFLGDYARVSKALAMLEAGPDGVAISCGVSRDRRSNMLKGFRKICLSSAQAWTKQ